MNLEKKIFIVPIIFNLIVISFLYIDFYFPVNRIDNEKFSSFYNVVKKYAGLKGGGREIRNILECKSGKIYYVIDNSAFSEELVVGQKIEIEKTFFFGKPKLVKFIENKKQFNISLLSENLISIGFIISILVSLLSLFFEIKYLEIFLSFATAFVFFTAAVYMFCF